MLRAARFVRAFRDSLRAVAKRPGFRVVHYLIQEDHAHFLVEANARKCLANGMKSLGSRCAVLKERYHHVVKRTPTDVRRALAYILLNIRKHHRQRRRRIPPVVLDGRVRDSGSTAGVGGRRLPNGMPIRVGSARWRKRVHGCCARTGVGWA